MEKSAKRIKTTYDCKRKRPLKQGINGELANKYNGRFKIASAMEVDQKLIELVRECEAVRGSALSFLWIPYVFILRFTMFIGRKICLKARVN